MQKQIFKTSFLAFLTLFHSQSFAENTFNNENNQSIENQIKKELQKMQNLKNEDKELKNNSKTKNYDELIESKPNEENLDYLFKDSKFPVDDYIWKGGFKKPSQDVNEAFIKAKNERKSLEQIQSEENNQTQAQNLEEQLKQELQKNIEKKKDEEEKQKLKEQNTQLQAQLKQQSANSQNIHNLMRDVVLGERYQTGTYISNPNSRYGADSFSNQKNIDTATNEHRLYRTILAGTLIPATLTTAISSDIEGIVTAQVEQDIYARMGRGVLIPRGSQVIGFYQNDNKIGQDRLNIIWREIITPQGVDILLTNAIASDTLGMNGAKGELNNKYMQRYGIPFTISTLSNMLLLTLSTRNGNGGNSYSNQIYDQSNQDLTTIVKDILEQQAQIKPTIEIRQGSRIFIRPTAHIWFPKPKNGEVLAEFFNNN